MLLMLRLPLGLVARLRAFPRTRCLMMMVRAVLRSVSFVLMLLAGLSLMSMAQIRSASVRTSVQLARR